MPGRKAGDSVLAGQHSEAFQSGTLWATYHDRNGLMQQQRTSRRISELGERTNHPILRNVLEQEVTEQNSRMDWPARTIPHTKQNPAQPVCSERMERGGTPDFTQGTGRRGSHEPPWATVSRTMAKRRGRKHWSQVTEPPGSPFGIKRSRGPFGSTPSLSTGRLSAHSSQQTDRSPCSQLNKDLLFDCDPQQTEMELLCVLRTLLTSKALNTHCEHGRIGQVRQVPGLFSAREYSSLLHHMKWREPATPATTTVVLQSEVNYMMRALDLLFAPRARDQLESHALNCSAYHSITDAHLRLKSYFETIPPAQPDEYGNSDTLLFVKADRLNLGITMCTFQPHCETAVDFFRQAFNVKSTLTALPAQCCRRVQLVTLTPELAGLTCQNPAGYFKQPATLAMTGPQAQMDELLIGMSVQAFFSSPMKHAIGPAVWQVFRLVLWHDSVELKQYQFFHLAHGNVQRRLLYVLDKWCSACNSSKDIIAMVQPEFYWKDLQQVQELQNLKPFRMQLQSRFQTLVGSAAACAASIKRLQMHKALPLHKLKAMKPQNISQFLCSRFLLLGKRHLAQANIDDFVFDMWDVPITIPVNCIYLAASVTLLKALDLDQLKSSVVKESDVDTNAKQNKFSPSLRTKVRVEQVHMSTERKMVLESLRKKVCCNVDDGACSPISLDIGSAGKWGGFRLMLQQPSQALASTPHRAIYHECTPIGDVRHFECEWNNYKMPQEEAQLHSDMLAMHKRMQQLSKEDQCNEEALSIHRSCTELNKQIKEMEAEQSRNIVPHTVQQQEALKPVETFVLTPPCNLGCVGSCVGSTLRDSIKKGLSNVRIAASQFILNRYVVIKLNVLLPSVHTLNDLKMAELSNKSKAFLLVTQQRCGLDGIPQLYITLPTKLNNTDPSMQKSRSLVRSIVKSVPGWRNTSPQIRLDVLPETEVERHFHLQELKTSVMHGVLTCDGPRLELVNDTMPWYVKDLPDFLCCNTDSELNRVVKDWLPTTGSVHNNIAARNISCMQLLVYTHLSSSGLWNDFWALMYLARPCTMCSMQAKRANGANNLCTVLCLLAQQELQRTWCTSAVVLQPKTLEYHTKKIDLYKLSEYTVTVHSPHVYNTSSDWGTDLFDRIQSKLYAMKAALQVLNSCIHELGNTRSYIEKHCTWLFSPASPAHFYTNQLYQALQEEHLMLPAAPVRDCTSLQFMATALRKLQGSGNGMQVNHTLHYMMCQMLLENHGVVAKLKAMKKHEDMHSHIREQLNHLQRDPGKHKHKIAELKHKQLDLKLLSQLSAYCWNIVMCQVYLWYVALLLPLRQESEHYIRESATESMCKNEAFCFYRKMLYVVATKRYMCEMLTKHLKSVIPESLQAHEVLNQVTCTGHPNLPPYADSRNLHFVSRCREEMPGVPQAWSLLKEFNTAIESDYSLTLRNLKELHTIHPNEYFSKLLAAAGNN